jgi:lipopolysaccharide export system protein LptA
MRTLSQPPLPTAAPTSRVFRFCVTRLSTAPATLTSKAAYCLHKLAPTSPILRHHPVGPALPRYHIYIPMRGTRWLLLVAIVAIVSGLGLTYRAQKKVLREQAPPKPAALPDDLNSSAVNWTYTETNSNHTTVEISARDAKEARDSSRVDLTDLTLKLHSKNGETYDLIKSAAASVFKADHRFYSEGEVQITLAIPEKGEPKHTPISIKSSGVTFDTSTGQADTDRPCDFVFEHGTGQATGASYDPTTHDLHLKHAVTLDWKPVGPHAKPMKIEAATLYYKELSSEIWIKEWGKLTRDTTVVEGTDATIKLQDEGEGHKAIRSIEALQAHGNDTYPKRKLQYAADRIWVDYNEDGELQKITGEGNAQLVAASDASETTVAAHQFDLHFEPRDQESVLTGVNSAGSSVLTSRPLPVQGRQPVETHILRSEKLDMKMRPDGREIENIVVPTPGTIEFIPNLAVQHHRLLTGKDMFIAYGAQNRVELFRANDVRTSTDPTAEEKKRNRGNSVTTSKQMEARFDPKTGQLSTMEQTGDFTYDEGERKARAAKGSLDQGQNMILLENSARMNDATGSTTADRIRLNQLNGDFTAEGRVNSSRLPEKDQKKNSDMLSGDEPLHAQADRMESSNRNRKIRYQGGVRMWQAANRIHADTVDLDREKHVLVADGHVITNLWEEPKDEDKKKTAVPVLTEVRAPHLVYTDQDRLAVYTGGAALKRPNLQVKSREIRAFLAESGADSRLEKAFADGAVQIVQQSKGVTYNGTAEHSEYYTEESKVILTGGMPKMVDSCGNSTLGPGGLTYYPNDDRLVVIGSPGQAANSRLQRKKTCK